MKDEVDDDDAGASSSVSLPETTISYGNPRASRNMAEKQRRDNLNTNISAMATLVPTVAESPRKMDKISILRLAAAHLRMHYTLGRGTHDFLPEKLRGLDLEQYIVANLSETGGFIIVITRTGKIVYVSRQVEEHLGHVRADLLGQSLYTFVHPKDHEELTKNLTPDEMQSTLSQTTLQITNVSNDGSNSSEDSASLNNEREPFTEQRRSFELRMLQRAASRREHTQYECLHVSGILRLADACRTPELNPNRARHREVSSTNNDIIFVGVARLLKKRSITELSIIDANKDEYVTRHLVDGRIIYCDHRVSLVAGYLSKEVSGLSAFSFMHKDDFRWTMIGLRQMYDRAETCGTSCYRLRSKTGEFIYLRTHGYLEFDKDTQTVESFVCINTLVSEREGMELVKEMKKRFSATVSETTRAIIQSAKDMSFALTSNSKSSLEDPSQLQDAITHLLKNLPSPTASEDRLSPPPIPDAQYAKAAIIAQRLPPPLAQASKIGINKIDHYLVLQGKGNRTPKQDRKSDEKQTNDRPMTGKNRAMLEQDSLGSPATGVTIHEIPNQMTQNCTDNEMIPCDPGTSRLDVSQNINMLNTNKTMKPNVEGLSPSPGLHENRPCTVKIENAIEILKRFEKQEPVMDYYENEVETYSLKRTSSDEDIRETCPKRRHYANCRPFVNEEYSGLSGEYNQYNNRNSQSVKVADSPSSSLNEVSIDYQQLDPSIRQVISNADNEHFGNMHDFKEESLLSPGMEANPDFLMKIFNDLNTLPMSKKNFNEAKVQDNNASDEISRQHLQLVDCVAFQEKQLKALAPKLENPELQAQRKNLMQLRVIEETYSNLQAEINTHKKSLEILQNDHRNIVT